MRFRFTIANKIGIGFGVLMVFVLINILFSRSTLKRNDEIRQKIANVYQPSAKAIDELSMMLTESKILIENWVTKAEGSTNYKKRLINLHKSGYPELSKKLKVISNSWSKNNQNKLDTLFLAIDSLMLEHKLIMNELSKITDYGNTDNLQEAKNKVKEEGAIMQLTDRILLNLTALTKNFESQMAKENDAMKASFQNFKYLIIWTGVILFFTIFIIALVITSTLVRPINLLKRIIINMSQGELPDKPVRARSDEIGEMAKALNDLINGLKKISQFSKEIGKGNYTSDFKPLGSNDELGNSLLLMRQNLKTASEEAEMRRIENFQRSWTSQGLAEFGEMLRESKDSLEELTNQILTRLVRYLDASVGGLFILNDDNKEDVFLELIAFYAFDRRKYTEKRIEIGESLVGQCVLENETIFMSEIPKDYINITSGLGKDDPRSLLIVPLKLNEEVYGVVELASFKTFEPYQIEFVEKIGESIASTISSAKINLHTSKLLQESNEKSERLTKQEEESRKQIEQMEKSIEELKIEKEKEKEQNKVLINQFKTDISSIRKLNDENQKELEKTKMDYKNVSHAVDNALGTYALSITGEFIEANDRYLQMAGISFNELKGKKLDELMAEEEAKEFDIQNFIPNLLSGHIYRKTNRYLISNESKWFYETFTPLYDEEGKFTKILSLVSDLTESKVKEQEFEIAISKLQEDMKKLKHRMV
ncbi:MAG: GAF domain-containing protein [Bacteroidales bacterium]|nr:GAF domain-containing protein [Bacteroidales bacterium]